MENSHTKTATVKIQFSDNTLISLTVHFYMFTAAITLLQNINVNIAATAN